MLLLYEPECPSKPIPAASRSKAYDCSPFISGIAGSNPAESRAVCLLCSLCEAKAAASAMSWSLIQRGPTGCVWSRILNNEAPVGLLRHKKKLFEH
jgi:hypothetical protein